MAHGEPTRVGNTRHKKMQEALRQTSEGETQPGKRQTGLGDPCATPGEAFSYLATHAAPNLNAQS